VPSPAFRRHATGYRAREQKGVTVVKSRYPFVTALLSGLALMTCRAPTAWAEPAVEAAFRAGAIQSATPHGGDAEAARALTGPFVNAIHALILDRQAEKSWWAIADPDGKEFFVICPEPRWEESTRTIRFEGSAQSGGLAGAAVAGSVTQSSASAYVLTLRVKRQDADVEFVQTLTPLAEESETASDYRHPVGIRIDLPEGWKISGIEGRPAFHRLLPPDGTDTEVILAYVDGSYGIQRADDPRLVEGVEAVMREIAPALRRVGEVAPIPAGSHSGALLTWEGKAADGTETGAQAFLTVSGHFSFLILSIGTKERLTARERALRNTFASFRMEAPQRDPGLVGEWGNQKTEGHRSGEFSAATQKKAQALFRPDGSFVAVETSQFVGGTGDISVDSEERTVTEGLWYAGQGHLYLLYEDGSLEAFLYEVQGAPGSRQRVVSPQFGGFAHLNEGP
jgi:hypothetical protein